MYISGLYISLRVQAHKQTYPRKNPSESVFCSLSVFGAKTRPQMVFATQPFFGSDVSTPFLCNMPRAMAFYYGSGCRSNSGASHPSALPTGSTKLPLAVAFFGGNRYRFILVGFVDPFFATAKGFLHWGGLRFWCTHVHVSVLQCVQPKSSLSCDRWCLARWWEPGIFTISGSQSRFAFGPLNLVQIYFATWDTDEMFNPMSAILDLIFHRWKHS